MTKSQASVEIKDRLVEMDRDQLLAFLTEMDDSDTADLLDEAVELVNDIFSDENTEIDNDIEDVHSDIMGIIESVTSDEESEEDE